MQPAAGERGPFVWPPRGGRDKHADLELVPAPPPPPVPVYREPVRLPPATTAERLWTRVEHDLLDLRTAPLVSRLADAAWCHDEPHAACHRCGLSVAPGTLQEDGCGDCRGLRFPWSRMVRLGEYAGVLREVVHDIKFTRWRRLGCDIGRLLGAKLAAELAAAHGGRSVGTIIVPAPISLMRRLTRGIDHTLAICRGVREQANGTIVPLLRRRHRASQLEVPPSQRASNIAGAIRPCRGAAAQLRRAVLRLRRNGVEQVVVVVVDDVVTSGATMRACCRTVAGLIPADSVPGSMPLWAGVIGRAEVP